MDFQEIDRKTVAVSVAAFVVTAGIAFLAGSQMFAYNPPQRFHAFPDVTANSSNNIATAHFDSHSIDLMYEDSKTFKAYLDLNRDGSFDKRFTDLVHDGTKHETSKIVTLGNNSYRLYFTYRDSKNESGDGHITLYRVLGL
ncbi:MAG: hypothetical protein ABEJ99_03925 [Candidatus Nanohaloarchaea archaeon]